MFDEHKKGTLLVLSGPSGVGKNTLINSFLSRNSDIHYSISATTRKPRPQEQDGINYYFLSPNKFHTMVDKGDFLEWAEFCGNYYGTPYPPIEAALNAGQDVIMDIEIQGAKQVKEKREDAVLIFLVPPSVEELARRIRNRKTETDVEIEARLNKALIEMEEGRMYDYYLVHDNTEQTVEELEAIRKTEDKRIKRINWDFVVSTYKGKGGI